MNDVDTYWAEHLVREDTFETVEQSLASVGYLRSSSTHPMLKEFMDLYGTHTNETVLDYGCGPGDDVIGFALKSKARKIIGMDISAKVLEIAKKRLLLHEIDHAGLVQISDMTPVIPLEDESIDYIHSCGVLQHTTNPEALLKEFFRVLKKGGSSRVMVYNRDSIYFHFDIAFIGYFTAITIPSESYGPIRAFRSTYQDVDEFFAVNTDGKNCPISRCYKIIDFTRMCKEAGFGTEYLGGYVTHDTLNFQIHGESALRCIDLAEEHKEFIGETVIEDNLPMHDGKVCGIGGVYKLRKEG